MLCLLIRPLGTSPSDRRCCERPLTPALSRRRGSQYVTTPRLFRMPTVSIARGSGQLSSPGEPVRYNATTFALPTVSIARGSGQTVCSRVLDGVALHPGRRLSAFGRQEHTLRMGSATCEAVASWQSWRLHLESTKDDNPKKNTRQTRRMNLKPCQGESGRLLLQCPRQNHDITSFIKPLANANSSYGGILIFVM